MRLFSRELIVGFLLVLVVSACQSVQPASEANAPVSDATATSTSSAESIPVTDTVSLETSASLTESVPATDTATFTEASPVISATAIISDAAVVSETESTAPVDAGATADPALMEAGLAVYRAQYCGVCHTLDAAETRGTFGPPHSDMGAMAEVHLNEPNYQGAATTPSEYIRESIVDPMAFIVPGYATTSHRMPAYAHLDNASLDAMVAFLLAQ